MGIRRVHLKRDSLSAAPALGVGNRDRFVTVLKCFLVEYLSETLLVRSQCCLGGRHKSSFVELENYARWIPTKYLLLR